MATKKTLYAVWANGRGFVKQASSPTQFRKLCILDEASNGYVVPIRGRRLYEPDFVWKDGAWHGIRIGSVYAKLPFRT